MVEPVVEGISRDAFDPVLLVEVSLVEDVETRRIVREAEAKLVIKSGTETVGPVAHPVIGGQLDGRAQAAAVGRNGQHAVLQLEIAPDAPAEEGAVFVREVVVGLYIVLICSIGITGSEEEVVRKIVAARDVGQGIIRNDLGSDRVPAAGGNYVTGEPRTDGAGPCAGGGGRIEYAIAIHDLL